MESWWPSRFSKTALRRVLSGSWASSIACVVSTLDIFMYVWGEQSSVNECVCVRQCTFLVCVCVCVCACAYIICICMCVRKRWRRCFVVLLLLFFFSFPPSHGTHTHIHTHTHTHSLSLSLLDTVPVVIDCLSAHHRDRVPVQGIVAFGAVLGGLEHVRTTSVLCGGVRIVCMGV
jgi:hypothetical protein